MCKDICLNKNELTQRLEALNITKKEFADLANVSYNTVNNWNNTTRPVPEWVESWLENYSLARKYKIIEKVLQDTMKEIND